MSAVQRPRQRGRRRRCREQVPPTPKANVCRVCMGQGDAMASLHDNVVEKLVFCTGLQIAENDGLPEHICDSCSCLLDSAYLFKTTCLNSDAAFRGTVGGSDAESEHSDWMLEEDSGVKQEGLEKQKDNHNADPTQCEYRVRVKRRGRKNKGKNNDISNVDKSDGTDIFGQEMLIKPNPSMDEEESLDDFNVTYVTSVGKVRRRVRGRRHRPLQCEICYTMFPDIPAAKRHADSVHKSKLISVCKYCGKMFKKRWSYNCHLLSHRTDSYFCKRCSYSTCHKPDLLTHMWTHSGVKKFQCELCAAAPALCSHARRAHEQHCEHACPLCTRVFVDRQKLLQHLDLHSGVKRYPCDICGAAFDRREHWTRHMLQRHGVRVETPRLGRQKTNTVDGERPSSTHVPTVGHGNADPEDATLSKGDGEGIYRYGRAATGGDRFGYSGATTGGEERQLFTVGLSNTVGDSSTRTDVRI